MQTTATTFESIRRHERAQLDIYVNKIVGDEPHLARVRDISAGGVYLYKLIEPERATVARVGIELLLPGSEDIIWAIGRVVRHDDKDGVEGVAIEFVRIAEQDRQAIADFVALHKARAGLESLVGID